MAISSTSTIVAPELWAEAVEGALGTNALGAYDKLWAGGVIISNPNLLETSIGKTVNVPYDTMLPDFEEITVDGNAGSAVGISRFNETATVKHWSLPYEATGWATMLPGAGDLLDRASTQFAKKVKKHLVDSALTAAIADGLGDQSYDLYSTGSAVPLSFATLTDAAFDSLQISDPSEIGAIVVSPSAFADITNAGTNPAAAYFQVSANQQFPLVSLAGTYTQVPVSMSAVTATSGSATLTLSGTPSEKVDLRIVVTKAGARGTAEIKISTDGGKNYITGVVTAASVQLNDSAKYVHTAATVDTGVDLGFANETFNLNDVYTATTTVKNRTIVLRKGALLAHWNLAKSNPYYFYDGKYDKHQLTSHLYGYSHRYLRCGESFRPGVVVVTHN